MKKLFLFVYITGLTAYWGMGQKPSLTPCEKAGQLAIFMEAKHVTHAKSDQKISERSFDLLFKRLDPLGLVFLKTDIDKFSAYRTNLHTNWSVNSCAFLNLVAPVYKKRLLACDSLVKVVLNKPLDFKPADVLTVNTENRTFATTRKEHAVRWNNWIKLEALGYLFDTDAETGEIPLPAVAIKDEPAAREKVRKAEQKRINRRLNHPGGPEAYVTEVFLDAIARSFDPHSTYFTFEEKQEFQDELSTDVLSFGFELQEGENEHIEIAYLVPGGSAWKSNAIHEGDRVLKIMWDDKTTWIMSETELEETERKLQSVNTKEITVTILSTDGDTKQITLAKEKTVAEDNIVNSFLLQGERRMGYIALPGFYTEWESDNPLGCANDVAKEILKLKEENITGLILDLRDNGGGSMMEAIQLAGIFINEGPILVTASRDDKPRILKDINRGTIYNGPLLVLVNRYSASASEIVAATLQDYNRAIIAGGSTYGKATGQVILPLDTSLHRLDETQWKYTPSDYSKVTIQKLYRVNSTTHQQQGVIPDIEIPDITSLTEKGEKDNPFCIRKDSVNKKVIYTPLAALPVSYLKQKSIERLSSDTLFKAITALGDSVKNYESINSYPLQLQSFYNYIKRGERIYDLVDNNSERQANRFKITNHKYDAELFNQDTYHGEINKRYLQYIEFDPAVSEAYNILLDLILKP